MCWGLGRRDVGFRVLVLSWGLGLRVKTSSRAWGCTGEV